MSNPRFLAVCLNPVLQKTLTLEALVPGAVNRLAAHRLDASGKGVNVARVLGQLGEEAVHLTQLGGRFRDQFRALAADDEWHLEWRDSGSEIRFCFTVLERTHGLTTELVEEAEPVAAWCQPALESAWPALLAGASWVTISGTKAAGFSPDIYPRWVAAARAAGKGVVLDLRGPDLVASLPSSPNLIKPNYDEFVATFFPGQRPEPPAVHEAMGELARRYGVAVVVTRGSEATWVATPRERWTQPVEPVPVVNATGSGDAFTAGLVATLARGGTLREAIAEGQRCGARNCTVVRPGSLA